MNELKEWSIWAARLGLFFSFFLYIAGYQGPRDEIYPAAFLTLFIFGATFVPEKYHSDIQSYGSLVLWNTTAVLLLLFVFYASSTATLLVNEKALPGFFNILRDSEISLLWIIVVPGLFLTPLIPRDIPLFKLLDTIWTQVPPTSRVRPSGVQPRTPVNQTARASSTTRSEQQVSPGQRARRDTPNGKSPNETTSNKNTSTESASTGTASTGATSTGNAPDLPVPPNPEASTSTT